MKTHYTAKELEGVLGLPTSERAIRDKAKREGWQSQKRSGYGGGLEYALASLPLETQIHLQASKLPAVRKAAPAPAIKTAAVPVAMADLPDWQRNCADARLGIMRLLKAAIDNGHSVKPAIGKLVSAATSGELPQLQALIPLANARPGQTDSRTLSPRTVLRWWTEWKAAGFQASALVPDGERQPRPEPAWVEHFMKEWRKPQKPALTDVLTELKKSLPPYLQMPTYDQARHYLKHAGVIYRNKGRVTGNELSALKPYRKRLTDHMYPGDCYTADGHCFDGEVAHPYHGRPFRPEVTLVLDIATRMCVGWSCDLAESGLAVLDALRIACENFAVPAIFYTDNGSGYKNQMMTAPGTGILHRLGITPEYSRPRNPQAHGLSERGHQTILIKAAKELCTYMGKAMDNDAKRLVYKETRAAIRTGEKSAFLIEWDEFVEQINRAIADYNNRQHTGLPAYRDQATRKRIHYTPAQYWQYGVKRAEIDLEPAERPHPASELPDLYHPALEREVDRGYIRLGTLRDGRPKMYFSRDLEEIDYKVQVAYSPADASRVWVRDLQSGRLIAIAKLDGNSDPYFAQSKIEEDRYKRGKMRLKRLENHAEEARLEMHGPQVKTVQAPPTPEMKALKAKLIAEDAEITSAAPLQSAKIITLQLPEPEPVRAFAVPADEREKYKVWCMLEGLVNGGIALQEDEERFFEGFKRSAIWKAHKRLGK